MKPVAGSKMALSVLMFSCVAGSEEDPLIRIDDPVGPRLLRRGDGWALIGSQRWMHRRFRNMIEKRHPGAYGFNMARIIRMDDVLLTSAADGLDQLVVLGAGYDTRAYRMAEDLRTTRIFEVDLPHMSRDKQKRLRRAVGVIPKNVAFVEVDFNSEQLFERLRASGYERSRRTLFIFSGVSMYLPEEAVMGLFADIGAQGAGSSIVFDYLFADALTNPSHYPGAAEFIARTEVAGEKLRFGMAKDAIGDALAARGLVLDEQHDMGEIADHYLRRSDGTRAATPYGFAAVARASAVG